MNYSGGTFHVGWLSTAAFNCSGFSYNTATGVPVLTQPSPGAVITAQGELPIKSWSNSPEAKINPIVNSKSGPIALKEITIEDDKSITIAIDHDFANLATTAGFIQGATIPWVVLFLNQTGKSKLDGKYWVYSSIIIKNVPGRAVVEGELSYVINAEASGPFWPPI